MGAHLYWTIEKRIEGGAWWSIIDCVGEHAMGAAAWSMTGWDKLSVPVGFGTCDADSPTFKAGGYLTHEERVQTQSDPDCPWSEDAYWVRRMTGEEFVAIVRTEWWNSVLDKIYGKPGEHQYRCSAELRAAAALVQSLLEDSQTIRVTCWESQ
jgi:hypothetical protein